jgi:hypothetical protein
MTCGRSLNTPNEFNQHITRAGERNTVKLMVESARPVRMGMVGGGEGSFIGPVHRMAAELDGAIRFVAGAFSSDARRSREAGKRYGISAERAYVNYHEMFASERRRDDPIDFVAIVTPNYLHLPVARAALENGFHVLSDKPATATLAKRKRCAILFTAQVGSMGLHTRTLATAWFARHVKSVAAASSAPFARLSRSIHKAG